MAQITDKRFKELYKIFQKQKNNLGSDTEFAEFLNKKNIVPGTPGATTGVLNKEFNSKTVNGRRQRLGIKTPTAGKIIGSQLANRTKIENLLQKEITKANNGDKFVSQAEISFKVEDKLNLKPKTVISPDTGKPRRVPRYVPSKGGPLGAYPILYDLESQTDKVDNVLKDLLIEQEPLKERFVDVVRKRTQAGDRVHTLKYIRSTPTFKAIKDQGAELLVQAAVMDDYKGLNFSDQLSMAMDKQLGKPVYTGLGGVKSRFYGPNYVAMKFAKESWNQNKGEGPIQFFDSKGKRIEWKRGLKLPIRGVSFSYKGKNHTYKNLANASYIKKYFPEVFEKTMGVNNLKSRKVDNPFKPGSKINLRDLVQKVQEKGYGWSPRFTKFDILHGPGGVKDNPFTNLRYNTRDINQLELGLFSNLKSKKITKSQYNQALKNVNTAFKGLKGADYDQAIIDRVTTQADKIKKGKFYGYTDLRDKILDEVSIAEKINAGNPQIKKLVEKRVNCAEGCLVKVANEEPGKITRALNSIKNFFVPKPEMPSIKYDDTLGAFVKSGTDDVVSQGELKTWAADNPMPVQAGTAKPGMLRKTGRALAHLGLPLPTAALDTYFIGKQIQEGRDPAEIAKDPLNWLGLATMEPLTKAAGVADKSGKLASVARLGMSPGMIRGVTRFLGLPGLIISGGLTAYDQYKKYQDKEGFVYDLFNKEDIDTTTT